MCSLYGDLGFVPAPMMFGALIDSTCRFWQTDSSPCASGSRGSCVQFDNDQLRWRTYGVVLGVQLVQLMLVVFIYCTIRRRRFDDDHTKSKQISVQSPADADGNPLPTFNELDVDETNENQHTESNM